MSPRTWILVVFFGFDAITGFAGNGEGLTKPSPSAQTMNGGSQSSAPASPAPAIASNTYPALPTLDRIEHDQQAALDILRAVAPKGVASVYGGSRLKPGDADYELARRFARLWTLRHPDIPIATGGGPGAMEAANRGASEIGGRSIGFAQLGLGDEKPNQYATHSHRFAYFPQREANLIDFARVHIVVHGGVGTHWEVLEILSKLQKNQLPSEGVILLGSDETWAPTLRYLKGILPPSLFARIRVAHTEQQALKWGEEQLAHTQFPARLPEAAELREQVRQMRESLERGTAPRRYVAVSDSAITPDEVAPAKAAQETAREIAEQHSNLRGWVLPQRNSAVSKSEIYDHAAGSIFLPGGPETQWELFELLTKVETRLAPPIPIVLQGNQEEWRPFTELLSSLVETNVAPPIVRELASHAEHAQAAAAQITDNPRTCCFAAIAP